MQKPSPGLLEQLKKAFEDYDLFCQSGSTDVTELQRICHDMEQTGNRLWEENGTIETDKIFQEYFKKLSLTARATLIKHSEVLEEEE